MVIMKRILRKILLLLLYIIHNDIYRSRYGNFQWNHFQKIQPIGLLTSVHKFKLINENTRNHLRKDVE